MKWESIQAAGWTSFLPALPDFCVPKRFRSPATNTFWKSKKKKTKRKKKGQQYRKHNILVDGRRRRFIEKATAASINQRPDNRITNTDDTRPDADDVIKAMEGFQNDDIVVIESPESRGWPLKNEP